MRTARISRFGAGAICCGLALLASAQAQAASVTFMWIPFVSGPTEPSGDGSFTFTSAALTPEILTTFPNSPPGRPPTFDMTASMLAAVGETVLGDITDFTLSYAGHTLTEADLVSGDSDFNVKNGGLLSGFTASHSFADGVLTLKEGPQDPSEAIAQFLPDTTPGEWIWNYNTPIVLPLPGAAWLLFSALSFTGALARFRPESAVSALQARRRAHVAGARSSPTAA